MTAYPDATELVFGTDTRHRRGSPCKVLSTSDSTAVIERFYGTMKDRTNVVRGFKNKENAELLTDAWLVHYNFFKEHEALGNVPPVQKMGLPVPFKDWKEVINLSRQAVVKPMAVSPQPPRITKPVPRVTPKHGRLPK